MSVYFIQLGKYLKVGYSENPERRFYRLWSSTTGSSRPWDCPKHLHQRTLLGYIPGTTGDEHRAHGHLSQFAVGCEFFLYEPEVAAYVERCLATKRVPRRQQEIQRPAGPAEFVGQVNPGPPEERARRDREVVERLDAIFAQALRSAS